MLKRCPYTQVELTEENSVTFTCSHSYNKALFKEFDIKTFKCCVSGCVFSEINAIVLNSKQKVKKQKQKVDQDVLIQVIYDDLLVFTPNTKLILPKIKKNQEIIEIEDDCISPRVGFKRKLEEEPELELGINSQESDVPFTSFVEKRQKPNALDDLINSAWKDPQYTPPKKKSSIKTCKRCKMLMKGNHKLNPNYDPSNKESFRLLCKIE
jgi:hypothetical protein